MTRHAAVHSKICKLVRFRYNICSGEANLKYKLAPITSGETHEQICDPAFDICPIRDDASDDSHGHTGQGRDEQQRGREGQEENPNELWLQ